MKTQNYNGITKLLSAININTNSEASDGSINESLYAIKSASSI